MVKWHKSVAKKVIWFTRFIDSVTKDLLFIPSCSQFVVEQCSDVERLSMGSYAMSLQAGKRLHWSECNASAMLVISKA